MKSYKVIGGDRKLLLDEVNAESMAEVGLLVAVEFGDLYFGCNIIENAENGDFCCISVKEYYERYGEKADPVVEASMDMVRNTRMANGFYDEIDDWNGDTTYRFPPMKGNSRMISQRKARRVRS